MNINIIKIIPLLGLLIILKSCASTVHLETNSNNEDLLNSNNINALISIYKKHNERSDYETFKKSLEASKGMLIDYIPENMVGDTTNIYFQHGGETWTGSLKQKAYGFLKYYNSVKVNFAGFGKYNDIDWDEICYKHFYNILSAMNSKDYYLELARLNSKLKDNHTCLYEELYSFKNIKVPALSVDYIEKQFVITSNHTGNKTIKPGSILTKINNIDVDKYYNDTILPFTAQNDTEIRNRSRLDFLLAGKESSTVKLTIDGQEFSLKRNRPFYWKDKLTPHYEQHIINNNVLYFSFNRFTNSDSTFSRFKDELSKHDLSKIKGLIIDLRKNSGGNSNIGDKIASYIVSEEMISCHKGSYQGFRNARIHSENFWLENVMTKALFKQNPDSKDEYLYTVKIAPEKNAFKAKTAVLISSKTVSAGEDLASIFKETKNVKLFGQNTSGSTGNGAWIYLPGYIVSRVSTGCGSYSNGDVWQGKGIEPDVYITPKLANLKEANDIEIKSAIEWINADI